MHKFSLFFYLISIYWAPTTFLALCGGLDYQKNRTGFLSFWGVESGGWDRYLIELSKEMISATIEVKTSVTARSPCGQDLVQWIDQPLTTVSGSAGIGVGEGMVGELLSPPTVFNNFLLQPTLTAGNDNDGNLLLGQLIFSQSYTKYD